MRPSGRQAWVARPPSWPRTVPSSTRPPKPWCVGGAMIGSATAWWTARDPQFKGRILVIERDPSYAQAASSLSHSSIRQQFGAPVNVLISRFAAHFIHNFRDWMQDPEAPEIALRSFGYLYLADNEPFAEVLRDNGFAAALDVEAYEPAGCGRCGGMGYKGRIGIYQLFVMSEELEGMAVRRASREEIEKQALEQGMRTLWDDGLAKVMSGVTSLEELGRVLV